MKDSGDAVALFLKNILGRPVLVIFPGRDDISHFLETFIALGVVVDEFLRQTSVNELLTAPHLHVK